MKKVLGIALLVSAATAHADVYVSDSDTLQAGKHRIVATQGLHVSAGHTIKPGEKTRRGVPLGIVAPQATGSKALIDASGLKYFINTDITFSTSSSASGAMSEASYTHAVAATTMNGGTTASTLNDAFDGYGTICVSLTSASGACETGNAAFTIYNKNGPASIDPVCSNQVVFPAQTIGGLSVSRKVYVSTDDAFARSLNYFTNTSGAPITFTMNTGNNLGSDSNTVVVTTSSGDAVATPADLWVTSFQNYSGTTSSDPRLGHVIQGAGASVPVSAINFVSGDDNPFWTYAITLNPGQTGIIMNFVTGQPSKAAAATQAAALASLPATAVECMSASEKTQVLNFAVLSPSNVHGTKTYSGGTTVGSTGTYTIVLSNVGQTPQADNPGNEFTDVLPANLTLVSATASSGTAVATVATNTVTWNGSIAPSGTVTITITARITSGAAGTVVSNQGTISYDGDNNGTNESTELTDDPAQQGAADPTSFTIAALPLAAIEAAPGPGGQALALLILMLAGFGWLGLSVKRQKR